MRPLAPSIEVDSFTRARTAELSALRSAVLASRTNRRAHQNLSWHLRRRTLSYSSRRAPASVRAAVVHELANNGAQPPRSLGSRRLRKHRAKARFLRSMRALRNARPERLETHVWHAKRFRMTRIPAAHRIVPKHCNDRGLRSAYNAFAHSSIAHDASYLDIVAVSAPSLNSIVQAIGSVLAPHDAARIGTMPVTSGSRCARDIVIMDPATFSAIAPATVLFRPFSRDEASESNCACWLWVHPAASQVVVETMQLSCESDVTVELLRNEILTFQVFGPRAGFVLGAAIERVDDCGVDWDLVRHTRSAGASPACCVLSGKMVDPRYNFPPKRVQEMANAKQSANAMRTLSDASENAFSCAPRDSGIWDDAFRRDCVPRGSGERSLQDAEKQELPFLLMQRPGSESRGLGSGWDVILPKKWGHSFWRALMYANGSRALGLDEEAHLSLEMDSMSFPRDFPDSLVAQKAFREREAEQTSTYERKPKSKRVNYDMYRIQSPFYPDLAALAPPEESNDGEIVSKDASSQSSRRKRRRVRVEPEQSKDDAVRVLRNRSDIIKAMGANEDAKAFLNCFVRVVVQPIRRGRVNALALLCKPKENDVAGVVREEICRAGFRAATRETFGRVMDCAFSMGCGGPFAVAFVRVDVTRRLLVPTRRRPSQHNATALLRNCDSLQYTPVKLFITGLP